MEINNGDSDGSETDIDSDTQRSNNNFLVAEYEATMKSKGKGKGKLSGPHTESRDFEFPDYNPLDYTGPFPAKFKAVESDNDSGNDTETGKKWGQAAGGSTASGSGSETETGRERGILVGFAKAHDERIARILAGEESDSDDSESEEQKKNDALERKYVLANAGKGTQ